MSKTATFALVSTLAPNVLLIYIYWPQNTSCVACNQAGQIPDTTNQLCVPCVSQCSVCASLTTCQICLDGYFLVGSSNFCILQQDLHAQLIQTINPQIYNLIFSATWSSFLGNLSSYLGIYIVGLGIEDYPYSLTVASSSVSINFTFKSEIKNHTFMNLTINYTDSPNDEYLLLDKNLAIDMQPFCLIPTTYLKCKKDFNLFLIK